MGRRDLLTDDERRLVFGFHTERDALARLYTFGSGDITLIEARRRSGNRLGFALQPALIRHPGFATVRIDEAPEGHCHGSPFSKRYGFTSGSP